MKEFFLKRFAHFLPISIYRRTSGNVRRLKKSSLEARIFSLGSFSDFLPISISRGPSSLLGADSVCHRATPPQDFQQFVLVPHNRKETSMPILKAPPAEPKNETLQLRVSQDLKFKLMRYAQFIHANASYVVTAALERLFRKDAEFQEFLSSYKGEASEDHSGEEQPSKNAVNSLTK
jgi:hypothetical protein